MWNLHEMNKIQWNLNRNSYISIQEQAFKNVIWKMASIFSRPRCVNCAWWDLLPGCCYTCVLYWVLLTQLWSRPVRILGLYSLRHLTAKSREVSKPQDWMLQWLYRFEIWQVSRQQCCRGACQFSEWLKTSKPESRGFDTSRDLAVRCLTA